VGFAQIEHRLKRNSTQFPYRPYSEYWPRLHNWQKFDGDFENEAEYSLFWCLRLDEIKAKDFSLVLVNTLEFL